MEVVLVVEMWPNDGDVVADDLACLAGSHDVQRTGISKCFVRLIIRGQLDGVAVDCDLLPVCWPQDFHLGHNVAPLLYLVGNHGFEVRMSTTM